MKAKYITFINNEHGLDDIIIFSWQQIHEDVAKRLRLNVIGAGFLDVYEQYDKPVVMCHGRSDSIGCSADEGDSEIAARVLGIGIGD